jgi:hypothetical protein
MKPGMRRWRPILGLEGALTVTLTYMRRNRVQQEIAEDYGVSQPTISRAISAITPLLVQALLEYVPMAGSLGDGQQFIVDGTLLPCWSWAAHPDLYSGKHKTTGMKVLPRPMCLSRTARKPGSPAALDRPHSASSSR